MRFRTGPPSWESIPVLLKRFTNTGSGSALPSTCRCDRPQTRKYIDWSWQWSLSCVHSVNDGIFSPACWRWGCRPHPFTLSNPYNLATSPPPPSHQPDYPDIATCTVLSLIVPLPFSLGLPVLAARKLGGSLWTSCRTLHVRRAEYITSTTISRAVNFDIKQVSANGAAGIKHGPIGPYPAVPNSSSLQFSHWSYAECYNTLACPWTMYIIAVPLFKLTAIIVNASVWMNTASWGEINI